MPKRKRTGHWRRTRLLAIAILIAWMVVGLFLPFIALLSNGPQFGVGNVYVFMSQGVPILLLGLVIWFSHRQRGIDARFAMAEED